MQPILGILVAACCLLAALAGALYLGLASQSNRRRRAERRLADWSDWANHLVEKSPDAMLTIDEQGLVRSFNSAAEKLFGYGAAEIVGRHIQEIVPDARGNGITDGAVLSLAKPTEGGIGLEMAARHKDGRIFPIDLLLEEVLLEDRRLFRAVARDLSERKRLEAECEELESLQAMIDTTTAIMLVLDRHGRVLRLNRAGEEITGYKVAEVRARKYWEKLRSSGEWTEADEAFQRLASGDFPAEWCERWISKEGREFMVRLSATVMLSEQGLVNRVVAVGLETPESDKQESPAVPEENVSWMAGPEGTSPVERLARGIADNFNDLLTTINGYSDLLLYSMPGKDPLRRDVEEIKRAGERAASLTRQLLAFARNQWLQPRIVNLNELIHQWKETWRGLMSDKVQLSTVLDVELGQVCVDPQWIGQVLLNLVINARDAIVESGKVTVETANLELRDSDARRAGGLEPGPYVRLSVMDTGAGMDQYTLQHLFEPFFTTKSRRHSAGLGLSTVYGVVKQSGGGISVHSMPGQGTTVEILLPRAQSSSGTASQSPRNLFLIENS